MQHPDEGMIHTWLDGELSPEEAAAFEAHAAACEQCNAAIAEARGFIAASSRIVSSLDAVPGGVIPIAKPAKRMWYSSPQFRAAAAVLFVAGASLLVMRAGTQKATMAVSSGSEENEAAPAQRVMSAASPLAASTPAPAQPPAVADQAAGKMESAKPTVVSAPVPDTGIVSEPAIKAADAVSHRSEAFAVMQSDLKVVRVDSTAITKKTTYQTLSGSEVVLTEQEPAPVLSKVMTTTDNARQRAASGESVIANSPVAPALGAQRAIVVHTISWVKPSTRRRYTLSGPVPVEELEAIKARLLQKEQ